jgi:hypothetical protein
MYCNLCSRATCSAGLLFIYPSKLSPRLYQLIKKIECEHVALYLFNQLLGLCFYDAFHRAGGDALRRVKMTFALDAGAHIDDVNRISLGDRFGGAFGQASTTGNAFFRNFHCHG